MVLIEETELLSERFNDVVDVYITCGNNSWENPLFPSLIKNIVYFLYYLLFFSLLFL